MFVREGIDASRADLGACRASCSTPVDSLRRGAGEAVEAGLGGLMLFGVPADKDAARLGRRRPRRHPQRRPRATCVAEVGDDLVVMADLCLDEFTDHGHCGVLDADGAVDNDATLERTPRWRWPRPRAGAHVVGPSGMMDGQVGLSARRSTTPGSPTR